MLLGRRRGQPPVQQGAARRAAAERGARGSRRPSCGCSRCCAPPPSWRSRARSRAWSATTARSRAATRSSASTRRCAPRRGAATAPSAASCSWRSRRSARRRTCARSSVATCSTKSGQFEGFALLTATGGHKPFECVGEEQESVAAIRLLARDARWSGHSVVRRLVARGAAAVPCRRRRPGDGARAQRRARRAGGAAGGGPCASRSLTARASACGAPAARSRRSPISWRAGCPRARIAVAAFDAPPAADVRETLRAPGVRGSSARGDGAAHATAPRRARATSSCARRASRSTAPSCARCATAGTPVTTATSLWLAEHGGEGVIGVTGTKGKSTTAALASHLARAAGRSARAGGQHRRAGARPARRRARGADGASSSRATRSPICDAGPEVAVVTNLYREHTDWHGSRGTPTARRSCACSGCPACASRVLNARDERARASSSSSVPKIAASARAGWLGRARRAGSRCDGARGGRGRASCRCPASTTRSTCAPRSTALEALGIRPPTAAGCARRLSSRCRTAWRPSPSATAWRGSTTASRPRPSRRSRRSRASPARELVLIAGGQDRGQDYARAGARAVAAARRARDRRAHDGPRLLDGRARARASPATRALAAPDLARGGRAGARRCARPGASCCSRRPRPATTTTATSNSAASASRARSASSAAALPTRRPPRASGGAVRRARHALGAERVRRHAFAGVGHRWLRRRRRLPFHFVRCSEIVLQCQQVYERLQRVFVADVRVRRGRVLAAPGAFDFGRVGRIAERVAGEAVVAWRCAVPNRPPCSITSPAKRPPA